MYREVLVAFISSTVPVTLESTDLILEPGALEFAKTGLSMRSVLRLHRIACVPERLIIRQLGYFPPPLMEKVRLGLRRLFSLDA